MHNTEDPTQAGLYAYFLCSLIHHQDQLLGLIIYLSTQCCFFMCSVRSNLQCSHSWRVPPSSKVIEQITETKQICTTNIATCRMKAVYEFVVSVTNAYGCLKLGTLSSVVC